MKYQVGDLVLIKNIDPLPLPRPHPHPHPRPRLRLQNTYGIITATEKHTDIFEKHSTEKDNRYIWYSQVDQKEYSFYEDEVEGEVIR